MTAPRNRRATASGSVRARRGEAVTLPATASAPEQARRAVHRAVESWGQPAALAADAALAAGALVLHSCRWTGSDMTVSARMDAAAVLVTVEDDNPDPPDLVLLAGLPSERFGVLTANRLATSSGFIPLPAGGRIWVRVGGPSLADLARHPSAWGRSPRPPRLSRERRPGATVPARSGHRRRAPTWRRRAGASVTNAVASQ
jgi:hypothetical protein